MREKPHQDTFFGDRFALEALDHRDDPLRRLDEYADWDELLKAVVSVWDNPLRKFACGRKPWSPLLMLKILVLKRLYNLSDDQTEYQACDRLSFRRFLGVGLMDKVPDSKTIWLYSEALTKKNGGRILFDRLLEMLVDEGVSVKTGTIIDATFVHVPRQINTREENAQIKAGVTPKEWEGNLPKLRQKDVDARWTKKGNETHYGYKDHVTVDRASKIITDFTVTSASVHDSQELPNLAKEGDSTLHGDSAYGGAPAEEMLRKRGIEPIICEKGTRGHPLTEEQKASNHTKSSVRVRVEHVFATMENSMCGIMNRCIGFKRNQYQCGMMNFCYNLLRGKFLKAQSMKSVARESGRAATSA